MAKEREGKGVKKKYCKLCLEKVGFVDYKDEKRLGRFITDRGKIVPRRGSGTCARHQKQLTTATKRPRSRGPLPFTRDIYRHPAPRTHRSPPGPSRAAAGASCVAGAP